MLARELGKWMGEFRRASNEFKMQMEDELRASEQVDRQKQITAMEAAAPIPPPLDEPAEPEHPHMRGTAPDPAATPDNLPAALSENSILPPPATAEAVDPPTTQTADGARPIPIATSGSLHMMPPSTGLPTPRSSRPNGNPLGGLVDSIPEATPETESLAHGD